MNTFRALAMTDRVVLVHDTDDVVTTSELAVEQATLLLRQLEIAVHRARRFRNSSADEPVPATARVASRH